MYQSILTEVDNAVGIISLNKTERLNAVDALLIGEMTQALADMEADPAVRVVVLSARGKSFCNGTDLNWLKKTLEYSPAENLRDARAQAHLLSTLDGLAKPTLARIQGPVHGIGIGLIAACDIAVASYDVDFSFGEVRLGLVPALVSPYALAAVGERYCRRYMLSGERFSAAEAYRIGLVHEIVPNEEQLDEAIGEIVDNLLKNAPVAQGECKSLLRTIAAQPIDKATIEETAQRLAQVASSREGKEGLGAFIDKRKPEWLEKLAEPVPDRPV